MTLVSSANILYSNTKFIFGHLYKF